MVLRMAMKSLPALTALLVAGVLPRTVAAGEHPITQVTGMLRGLSKKVEFEGKREAQAYDKYERWCANSESMLTKAIQTQKESMSMLQSEISAKTKQNTTLSREISELLQSIADLQAADLQAQRNRADQASLYQQATGDLNSTVEAFEQALQALLAAKGSSTAMVQVLNHPRVREALALVEASKVDPGTRQMLLAIQQGNSTSQRPVLKAAGDYEAHIQSYDFKSDSVIELLKGLKARFLEDRRTADAEEQNSINAFSMAQEARQDETEAAEASKADKLVMLANVQRELTQCESDLESLQEDNAADTGSLEATGSSCQIKQREWEERSRVRSLELKAMEAAIKILGKASGVRVAAPTNPEAPTMPESNPIPTPEPEPVPNPDNAGSPSFVQLEQAESRTVNEHDMLAQLQQMSKQGSVSFLRAGADPRQKAVQLLRKAAMMTHSKVLERLAQQLSLEPGGAFDQVVNSIQRMVHHLQDEQKDEDKHKQWCDEEVSKTNTSMDDKELKAEELRLRIQEAEGTVQRLVTEVQEARDMLAQIESFMAEATEIRTAGKKENAEALRDAQQALDAIAQATSEIQTFYKDSGMLHKEAWELVQQPVTLPDEPSTWDSGYTGVSDPTNQPTGIITVLQRIGSQFATMEADTRAQEQTDQAHYEEQMMASKVEQSRRGKSVEMKEQEKRRLLESVEELTKSRKHYLAELEAVKQYMKDLGPACQEGDSTYDERKMARKEEIFALKIAEETLRDAYNKNSTSSNATDF